MSTQPTLIRQVRPFGRDVCDMRIIDGVISEIGASLAPSGDELVIEGCIGLLLPGLVNAHAHVDKTFWSQPWQPHSAGPSVAQKISNERRLLRELNLDIEAQSRILIERMVAGGTTAIRSHVDIDAELQLRHFEAVASVRESVAGLVDMQLVAFPQAGVIASKGTTELLEQALRDGAEVIGGVDPMGLDRDPTGQLDAIFALAERYGVEVDIHLHDTGEMGAVTLEMIVERTLALGLQDKVVVSHAFCLASLEAERFDVLVERLRDARIAIMSHAPSGGTPCPPVRTLDERGVLVFSGTDGIRDAWGPLNGPDLLERAYLVAYVNGFRDDRGLELALKMVSSNGAAVMNLPGYGLEVGCRADMLVVDAQNVSEAVVAHPLPRVVIKAGEIVAENGRVNLSPTVKV